MSVSVNYWTRVKCVNGKTADKVSSCRKGCLVCDDAEWDTRMLQCREGGTTRKAGDSGKMLSVLPCLASVLLNVFDLGCPA